MQSPSLKSLFSTPGGVPAHENGRLCKLPEAAEINFLKLEKQIALQVQVAFRL